MKFVQCFSEHSIQQREYKRMQLISHHTVNCEQNLISDKCTLTLLNRVAQHIQW